MPLYEYRCLECGAEFEVIQKFSDPPPASCRTCSGKVEKMVSRSAFQFRGTGWYVTDYAGKKSGGESAKADGAAKSDGTAKDKASATDSKPAETGAKGSEPTAATKPAEKPSSASAPANTT